MVLLFGAILQDSHAQNQSRGTATGEPCVARFPQNQCQIHSRCQHMYLIILQRKYRFNPLHWLLLARSSHDEFVLQMREWVIQWTVQFVIDPQSINVSYLCLNCKIYFSIYDRYRSWRLGRRGWLIIRPPRQADIYSPVKTPRASIQISWPFQMYSRLAYRQARSLCGIGCWVSSSIPISSSWALLI